VLADESCNSSSLRLFKLPPYFVDIVRKEVKSFQKLKTSKKKVIRELKI
jgi:hypothetical protein